MFEFFLRNNIESALKKYNRTRQFLNFKSIDKVLILFDIQNWDSISPVIEDLKQHRKQVTAWTVQPKLPKGQSYPVKFPDYVKVINLNTDINWMYLLRPEALIDFGNQKYDTLIDLSLADNDYILSLLLRNTSKFCVGVREREHKLYDFIIFKEEDKTILETYQEFKNYLTHIE